jgi:IS5 family transposase
LVAPEKLLKKHYKKVAAADGRPAYPALTMFKILLMQRWYSLSDAGMEEARGLKNGIMEKA